MNIPIDYEPFADKLMFLSDGSDNPSCIQWAFSGNAAAAANTAADDQGGASHEPGGQFDALLLEWLYFKLVAGGAVLFAVDRKPVPGGIDPGNVVALRAQESLVGTIEESSPQHDFVMISGKRVFLRAVNANGAAAACIAVARVIFLRKRRVGR